MAATQSMRYFYSEPNIESLLKYYKDGKFMIIKRKYEKELFEGQENVFCRFKDHYSSCSLLPPINFVGGPVEEDIKPFLSIVLKLSFPLLALENRSQGL
ncbi:hypothetical protein CEXT_209401 [Caerostris extrusa]|uniref:Uncharacterized protein n=1 Tax=Caerostris extrusa TaxID=172846 RepID=A0AAV4PML7_CAEEX|nr:hypothetical protein CEXT_209401 [Caerostris extrusa]